MADLLRLNTIVDSPTVTDGQDDAPATSRIQVAKLGKFRHPTYGTFRVTQEKLDALRRNLQEVSDGEAPADFDHLPDRGGKTEACGWIKALDQLGPDGTTPTPAQLWATVEWLEEGADAIRSKRYRYISPTIDWAGKTDDGETHGPTLIGAALMNRPFFSHMAAVSLSQTFAAADFTVSEELEDDPESPDADRSIVAAEMTDFAKFAQVFGLDQEATEDQILAKATEIVTASSVSLADRAKADGKVLFTAEEAATLKAKAADADGSAERLTKVEAELAEARFEQAFNAALTDPKGARVAPAEKESLREVFDLSEDVFAKQLDQRPALVNAQAKGARGEDDDAQAPAGVDPEAFQQDRRAQAYMAEHPDVSYIAALAATKVKETV